MKELMFALMAWASLQTGLPLPDTIPTLVFKDRCEIVAIRTAGLPRQIPCENSLTVGMYSPGAIYLIDTWDNRSVYSISQLLHELVHHMQFEAGDKGRWCDQERQAYDAQISWLMGADLTRTETLKLMGVNELTILMATSCGLQE